MIDRTRFLGDRTNGSTYATVLRPLLSSVCRPSVTYVLWLNYVRLRAKVTIDTDSL